MNLFYEIVGKLVVVGTVSFILACAIVYVVDVLILGSKYSDKE